LYSALLAPETARLTRQNANYVTEASLAATSFAPLDLLLANLTISDQRIHTRLRQPLPCAVHAKAESLGLNSILATKPLVIVGATLLYPFAIGMLSRSHAGRESEPNEGDDEETLIHRHSDNFSGGVGKTSVVAA
jgi:hypothetical protein